MSNTNEILRLFEAYRGRDFSSYELARYADTSVFLVPSKIRALKKEGHNIISDGLSYKLDFYSDVVSKEGIMVNMEDDFEEFKIKLFKEIDSTNSYAKKLALKNAQNKTVVIANSQTNGKGRMGRSFYSPAENGIYMSIIFKTDKISENTAMITVAAATAVSKAIEKMFNLKTQIKWVNDIYINNKKVCGILTETVSDSKGSGINVIIGIGINVKSVDSFPDELKSIAGALDTKLAIRNKLIASILRELNEFSSFKNLKDSLSYYCEKSLVIGRNVIFEKDGEQIKAKAIDIDDNANLIVENSRGEKITLNSGEISVKYDE